MSKSDPQFTLFMAAIPLMEKGSVKVTLEMGFWFIINSEGIMVN